MPNPGPASQGFQNTQDYAAPSGTVVPVSVVDSTGRLYGFKNSDGSVSRVQWSKIKAVSFPITNSRVVMANPPTITNNNGSDFFGGNSTIASKRFWPSVESFNFGNLPNYLSGFFSYSQGQPTLLYNNFPRAAAVTFANVTLGSTPGVFTGNWGTVSFLHDGANLEIMLGNTTGTALYTVKVNDQYVQTPSTNPFGGISFGNDGSCNYIKLAFGSVDKRRIAINFGSLPLFYGVCTGPNDSIEQAFVRGPRIVAIGDSLGQGTGASNGAAGCFLQYAADCMAWDDLWANGVSGGGYLATNNGTVGTFRQRLYTDIIPYAPDILLWCGGHNDNGFNGFFGPAIQAEALLCYQLAAAALPNCTQVVIGPFSSAGTTVTGVDNYLQAEAAINAAATAAGLPYISQFNQQNTTNQGGTIIAKLTASISAGATTFTCNLPSSGVQWNPNQTVEIGLGSTRQRCTIATNGWNGNTTNGTYTIDSGTLNAQTSGAQVALVGDPFITGTGHAGATTGFGNADLYVASDGTHYTDAGHYAFGKFVAAKLASILRI